MYALFKAKHKSKQVIAGVLISALTTGLSSAIVGYDYDVDPAKRKETPDFYGFIPDGLPRSLIFGCMVINGTLLLLSRCFCASMLMLVEKKYFLWYVAGDMALYLLQKFARGDAHYWFAIDGGFGIFNFFSYENNCQGCRRLHWLGPV
jgi:hypothetical protein